ncbi:hypothetical protein AWB67_07307 [Caballeronia terrestris]|uniref:Pentapeptide repeat-containing protein n=2 Tax=Caballeronia TaxID=1827195 RepID=A0A158L254_9BURK|nr:hypothetical protein AWB65_06342 [Caballeronia humi]SAL86910.1 hypothetical protein AWB67_07307 [Caballeronia terrestris]
MDEGRANSLSVLGWLSFDGARFVASELWQIDLGSRSSRASDRWGAGMRMVGSAEECRCGVHLRQCDLTGVILTVIDAMWSNSMLTS